ncbi:hypothetical protein [Amycolatopsis sp. NPDC054798]
MNYEFTLVVDRDPTDQTYADALFEASAGDLVPEGGGADQNVVHVTAEAFTLAKAISEAMRTVESTGLDVVGVRSGDLVSLKDIAARTDRSYESVRLLAAGQRGPGGFPVPMSTGQWALYSWAEVALWLSANYGTDGPGTYDREIAAVDHLVRARRMLAGDEHRAELAELVNV